MSKDEHGLVRVLFIDGYSMNFIHEFNMPISEIPLPGDIFQTDQMNRPLVDESFLDGLKSNEEPWEKWKKTCWYVKDRMFLFNHMTGRPRTVFVTLGGPDSLPLTFPEEAKRK